MLLAERLEMTQAVVTIAANLDTDAWTELHGFSALEGSLNPAASALVEFSNPASLRENGEPREVRTDLVHQRLQLVNPPDMRLHCQRFPSQLTHAAGHPFQFVQLAAGDGDICVGLGEGDGRRLTDATAAAGDDCLLAFQ